MHGPNIRQDTLFSKASPESRVPKDHLLRPIRTIADQALAELDGEIDMVAACGGMQRVTLGADNNHDRLDCLGRLRCVNATSHVAQNTSNRSSAIDGRTTRHEGNAVSQRFRKRIE